MTIAAVRSGLKTLLEGITTPQPLRVYVTEAPDSPELPCLILFNGSRQRLTQGESYLWNLPARLYVMRSTPEDGWAQIDAYRDSSGTQSIVAKLLSDRTLGGAADTSKLLPDDPGIRDPNRSQAKDIYSALFTFVICWTD